MRLQASLALAAVLVALSCWSPARGDEELTDLDDVDDEVDDELEARLDALENDGVRTNTPPKLVPQDRMKACFLYTFRRARHNRKLLEETVENLHNTEENREKEVDQEQFVNTVLFSWMMTCFMNVNKEEIASSNTAEPLTDELETNVFIPRDQDEALNSPQAQALAAKDGYLVKEMIDASKNLAKFVNQNGVGELTPEKEARWKQLSEVLVNPEAAKKLDAQFEQQEQLRQQQQQQQQSQSQSFTASAEPVPKQFGATYVICVFGVIFGLGVLAVLRLNGDKVSSSKERSAKSLRKEEKAKRELAKKQK